MKQSLHHKHGCNPECQSFQNGAIVPIIALFIVVILIFGALAIDSTVVATSKSQQQHTTEYVALAALNAFGSASGNSLNKLYASRDRAAEIAGINIMLGDSLSGYSHQAVQLGPVISTGQTASSTDGANGKITPGVWHFFPPIDCTNKPTPCPCNNGRWAGPCFQELDFNDPNQTNTTPNAFRADLRLHPDSPLRTLFAKVIGQDYIPLQSTATAAIVPHHGVLLVDLSRSSTMETHHPYERYGRDNSTEYAFKLTNTVGCNSYTDHTNPCTPRPPPYLCRDINTNTYVPYASAINWPPTICDFVGGSPPGLYTALYNYYCSLPPLPPRRGTLTQPTRHFKDDYGCYIVSYHDENGSPRSDHYLIDKYRCQETDSSSSAFCPNYHDGPEPLNTMLHGVNYALQLIAARQVPGDLIGAIGFDQSAKIPERRFNLVPPTDPSFTTLQRITDIDNQTDSTLEERIQNHFFFPRVDASSNYPEALKEALEMLKNAPASESAENFVAILSDGLTFCKSSGECEVSEAGFQESFNESHDLILNEYVPNKIRLHFLMKGSISSPHTLLLPSANGDGSCMSEEEARLSNPPVEFVDYSTISSPLADALIDSSLNFFAPNKFYELVQATNGIWGPIRPCCGSSCPDVSSQIASACAKATQQGPISLLPLVRNGRLSCDSKGKDARTQIEDYVNQVISRNPYVLVE